MFRHISKLVLTLGIALHAVHAVAGFQAHRISDPASVVKLDGALDEALWKDAAPHDRFYQTAPTDQVPAKVRTEVRIVYDKQYMYIGVTAFDPHPEQIRQPFARRDKASRDQDFVGLYLDPSGAHQSAQLIYVSARGALTDGVYSGTHGDDYSQDFDFDAATTHYDWGWSAEVRIPFSSIAYVAGQQTPWSLLVTRNMTREAFYRLYSGEVTLATSCNLCFSEPIEGLTGLPTRLNWSATPQLVLHRGREEVAGSPRRDIKTQDLSLDVKLRPDSATVIDATINPDFSQVELDAPQLSGNTRFGLSVQEKRPFFLEGSDMFQTPFAAIYTRSMTSPSWGARYTRRDARSDLTVLTVRDAGGGVVQLPSAYSTDYANQDFDSQATVARANLKLGSVTVGAIGSDRTLKDGRGYNRVIGPDFSWRRSDSEHLRGQVLASATTAHADALGTMVQGPKTTGTAAWLDWYREDDRWALALGAVDVSDDFRADNGFFSQVGYRKYEAEATWKWGKTGIFNVFSPYVHAERQVDRDGDVIFTDYAPGLIMSGPYDIQVDMRLRPKNRRRVAQGGPLFETATVWAQMSAAPGRVLAQVKIEGEIGDTIDVAGSRLGTGGFVSLYTRLRPHDQIELEPGYSVSWIDGKHGAEHGRRLYTEQLIHMNGIYHFGRKDTLRMILQHSLTRRDPGLYAIPVEPRSKGRTVSLVYGHAASLGRAAYVGLTLQKGETPGYVPLRRQNELFIKLSWQI